MRVCPSGGARRGGGGRAPAPPSSTRERSCCMTSRGRARNGTVGGWVNGPRAHSSCSSVLTAASAAAGCSAMPGAWECNSVVSAHVERASTPPPPTCPMMSSSRLPTAFAARRNAARSIWRRPGKTVCSSDGCIGVQLSGSRQSQMSPRASGTREDWGKVAGLWYLPRRARAIQRCNLVHSSGTQRSVMCTGRPRCSRSALSRSPAPG